MFKKFNKFLKKRNNQSDSFNRYKKKPIEFKTECPNKKRKKFKKHEKKGKSRRAYNDDSSSSSSSDEKEANLCQMTRQESDTSSVSSSSSINVENYSQLLEAFNETREEANRLALLNNRLKGLNNWLENRVKTLEEKLNHSKTDFESLEMIYKNSSCKCDSSFCENCESLQKKVHYLLKPWKSFPKANPNLKLFLLLKNVFLASLGWGLIQTTRTNLFQNPFQVSFSKQPTVLSKQQVEICHYCMKRGHTIRFYRVRRFYVPKGILKWVPKVSKVPKTPTNIIGPKFIRGPNLAS